MLHKYNKILKYNHGKNSVNVPFIIYFDKKSLHEKIRACDNNLEKSIVIKTNDHTPSGYSFFTQCSFGITIIVNTI